MFALTLAIECAAEAQRVDPDLPVQLDTILTQWVEDADPDRRWVVAEARLALHLRQMMRVDENLYRSDALVTHAEYQLFLDEKHAKGEYYQPDHWQDYQFPSGRGLAPVVGIRPSDATAFCNWLTERGGGEWQYRMPRSGEFTPTTVLPEKVTDLGYWTTSGEQSVCEMFSSTARTLTRQTLEQWIEKDRTPYSDLALALDLAPYPALARAFALAPYPALDLDRARAHIDKYVRPLILTMGVAFAYAAQSQQLFPSPLSWFKRLIFFWRSVMLKVSTRAMSSPPGSNASSSGDPDPTSTREKLQSLADDWLNAYVALVILEERRQGNLPAFEGIRLVKERKRNGK